jgi:large subunit ribosomal protein L25
MAEIITLAAESRKTAGKGTARAARREGRIPAVVYGNKVAPIMVTVDRRELEVQLNKSGFFIRLMDITVDGEAHRVLPRDVQAHPVTDAPLHVDFLRYSADRKIAVEVPVAFINEEECPGIKVGGVLNIVRHAIEVLCTADQIPEGFTLDLTGLEIGDSIHAATLTLPEGVQFAIADRDFTIATIASPTLIPVEEEETPAEGEEGEEGVEGEEGEEGAEGEAAAEGADGAKGKKDDERQKDGGKK